MTPSGRVRRLPAGTHLRSATAFVAVLVGLRLVVGAGPVSFPVASQAALFGWPAVVAVAALGTVGLVLAGRTGAAAVRRVEWRERLFVPVAVGAVVGGVLAGIDLAVGGIGVPHVPLPWSVPYYAYGALVSEALYRLFPLPVAAALGGLAGERWADRAFWLAAVATSLVEPLGFVPIAALHDPAVAAVLLALLVAFNLATAVAYRRGGATAAVALRLGAYAVWHVLYGGVLG